MGLRIIGGELKGREVRTPKTEATRPVTSLLRKSIFDSCQMFIEGTVVLDLFAGSGVIGLEALSRGAAFAIFVDIASIAVRCIRENIERLGVGDRAMVLQADAFAIFPKLRKTIDIAFIDPPYPIGLPGYLKLLKMLKEHSNILSKEAHFYLEIPSTIAKEVTQEVVKDFTLIKERKSSTTTLLHMSQ